jgi:hypothetical protein
VEPWGARTAQLKRRNITRAAVGRDCRSPTYHKILKAAIHSTGVDVVDIGMCRRRSCTSRCSISI